MSSGSEAAWEGGLGAEPHWSSLPDKRAVSVFQWLHLCSLFVLLSVVGAAGMMLLEGLGASVARLPLLLHWWVPPALGIVAAALPVRHHTVGRLSSLILMGALALLLLDLIGFAAAPVAVARWVRIGGEFVAAQTAGSPRAESWVLSIWAWLSGALAGGTGPQPTYPAGQVAALYLFDESRPEARREAFRALLLLTPAAARQLPYV